VTIETGVNAGIRNGKSTFLIEFDVIKTLVVSISQKKSGAESLQPALEFDNFKSRLKSCIFKSTQG
jgi:hypothetical protein